jgi:diphthamide synthase (EF-2-diphthine--ammonia ligase)
MVEENLTTVEIARRNGCEDIRVLAEIERAEYISELLHSGFSWISRKVSNIAHDISALFQRHAH